MNSASPGFHDLHEGAEIAPRNYQLTRRDLVRYAGASGDFNPIHWNQRIATSVGLPDVIAHGMLTMALAGRYLTEWAGDPAAVTEFDVRFSAPVVEKELAAFGIEGRLALVQFPGEEREKVTAAWREMRGITHLCINTMGLGLPGPEEQEPAPDFPTRHTLLRAQQ